MKQRLQATAEHHRNKSVETGADHDAVTDGDNEISKQFQQTKVLHEKLSGYVCKPRFSYWFIGSDFTSCAFRIPSGKTCNMFVNGMYHCEGRLCGLFELSMSEHNLQQL